MELCPRVRGVVLRQAGLADIAGGIARLSGFAAVGIVAAVRLRKRLD